MDVVIEHSINNIKNKMTEIRRNRDGMIYQNYYNNCDSCEEIFVLYGSRSVVFWINDNDIVRAYFYSSDKEELGAILENLPAGCILEYLTKTKDEFLDFLSDSGLCFLYEMHKMVRTGLTEEEKIEIKARKNFFKGMIYRPENVYCANLEDLEDIYSKLYEVFDPRESHLPNKKELASFIENQWVSVYREDGKLQGFQMFKVEADTYYGYQIWNGTGPEGYFSLIVYSDYLFEQYMARQNKPAVKPSYCWVNVKNKKSYRLIEYWGQRFCGLYCFVYEKTEA